MVLAVVLAMILKYYGGNMVLNMYFWKVGCTSDPNAVIPGTSLPAALNCMGDAAVYRISFILAGWFFLIMLGCLVVNRRAHVGCWGVKLLILVGSIIGSFWAPNNIFDNSGYAWPARIISVVFLVLQVIMFINFAYQWNESWLFKAHNDNGEENKTWFAAILASAGVMFLASLILIVLLFVYFGSCGLNVFITVITLILIIAFTGLQLRVESNGSVLTSGVVAIYLVYLAWGAQMSNPSTGCGAKSSSDVGQIVLGIVITALSLAWTTFSASSSKSALACGGGGEANLESPIMEDGTGARRKKARYSGDAAEEGGSEEAGGKLHATRVGDARVKADDEEKSEEKTEKGEEDQERYWFFHLVMFSGAVYMAMLLTDWGSGDSTASLSSTTDAGTASMWVKITSGWIVAGLYMWTLLAEKCCPNRDFS